MQLKNAVISMEVSFTVTEDIDDATCQLNFTLVGPMEDYNSSDPRYWGGYLPDTYFQIGMYPLLGSINITTDSGMSHPANGSLVGVVTVSCLSSLLTKGGHWADVNQINDYGVVGVENGEVPCRSGLNQFLLAPYGTHQFIFWWEGT